MVPGLGLLYDIGDVDYILRSFSFGYIGKDRCKMRHYILVRHNIIRRTLFRNHGVKLRQKLLVGVYVETQELHSKLIKSYIIYFYRT